MRNMYIVCYTTGSYDSFCRVPIFVTKEKDKAEKYVEKFNRICDFYHNYYYNHRDKLHHSLMEELFYLSEVDKAYFEEVEER